MYLQQKIKKFLFHILFSKNHILHYSNSSILKMGSMKNIKKTILFIWLILIATLLRDFLLLKKLMALLVFLLVLLKLRLWARLKVLQNGGRIDLCALLFKNIAHLLIDIVMFIKTLLARKFISILQLSITTRLQF